MDTLGIWAVNQWLWGNKSIDDTVRVCSAGRDIF